MFGKNDASLGVKNGQLGTVLASGRNKLEIKIDGGQRVRVNAKEYNAISHGYAMTVHKSQGVTVDRTKVLVTRGWDKHLAYVGMSRHRNALEIYFGKSSFARKSMVDVLSEDKRQLNALDFAASKGLELRDGRFIATAHSGTATQTPLERTPIADNSYLNEAQAAAEKFNARIDWEALTFGLIERDGSSTRIVEDTGKRLTRTESLAVSEVLQGDSDLQVLVGDLSELAGTLGAVQTSSSSAGRQLVGLAASKADAIAMQGASAISTGTIRDWLGKVSTLTRGDLVVLNLSGAVRLDELRRVVQRVTESGSRLIVIGRAKELTAKTSPLGFLARRAGARIMKKDRIAATVTHDQAKARVVAQLAAVGLDLRDGRVHIIPDNELEQRAKRAEIMLRQLTTEKIAKDREPLDAQSDQLSKSLAAASQQLESHIRDKPTGILGKRQLGAWQVQKQSIEKSVQSARQAVAAFKSQLSGPQSALNVIRRNARQVIERQHPAWVAIIKAWANRQTRIEQAKIDGQDKQNVAKTRDQRQERRFRR